MSIGAIGAEILGGGGGIHPPPWYTSLKHPIALGINIIENDFYKDLCSLLEILTKIREYNMPTCEA